MATVIVQHAKKTNAVADPLALVDGPTWDNDQHVVSGLDQVNNTSDANKPVSTAQAAALALKASLSGNNAFTGNMTIGGTLGVTGTISAVAINASGIIASSNTTSGTSTTAAAITGKSLGLTENAWVGGTLNVAGTSNLVTTNITNTNSTSSALIASNLNFVPTSSAIEFSALRFSGAFGGGIVLADSTGRIAIWGQSSGTQLYVGFGTATGATAAYEMTAGQLSVLPSTASTSTTTGSLVNSGGFGNAGAIFGGSSILSTGTGGIGYGTGAGGTVTQITSRNTGVTLSKISGDIVLLSGINAAVSAATANTVIVTNTTVAITDTISISQKSGTDKYLIFVTNVAAGSFTITFFTTGGTTNESPVFHFNVIKGVNS